MECQESVEIQMQREDVMAILESHNTELRQFGVVSLRLFGSVARDEASDESDVDLLVGFDESPGFSSFMKLRIFLEDLLGAKVDLVTENGLRDRVRPYVEKDAIRVA
jgi:predicted nucleotidyltransferase